MLDLARAFVPCPLVLQGIGYFGIAMVPAAVAFALAALARRRRLASFDAMQQPFGDQPRVPQ